MTASRSTPMFRQYHDIKSRYKDAILLFRMGDFYEMFYDDALAASKALQITLTARGKGTENEAPMCGVPHHSADAYIAKLTEAGFRVAICEQLEDPATVKGLVKRDVVRVITPGTVTDTRHLEADEPNSLAALRPAGDNLGVAWVDLSTGDFRLTCFTGDTAARRAADLLTRFNCRELLVPEEASIGLPGDLQRVLMTPREPWRFNPPRARQALLDRFGTAHLAGFGVEGLDDAVGAAGALLDYLEETQKADLTHIDRVARFQEHDHLILDSTTLANLEVLRTQREGKRRGSLLGIVDATVTAMGGRLLKERLVHPLRDAERINRRLDGVAELRERGMLRQQLRQALTRIADLERLLARLTLGTAGPRDLKSLGSSLPFLPQLREHGAELQAPALRRLLDELDTLEDMDDLLSRALVDEPPNHLRDGGLIREGHDADLDELRRLSRDGKQVIADIEARERERTGIGSLKVRYNRVFGYFIEVSKTNAPKVPEDYVRKQTLATAERFMTPELKETEEKVLTAQERMVAREEELFGKLRSAVLAESSRFRRAAADVARLDVAAGLAETAARLGWCRPQVDDGDEIHISEGRHPAVEEAVGRDRFVPNDVTVDGRNRQIQIITGPNMGGKSTLLRQVGLIVLLGQAGSFVPASRARLGAADRIFCRVGASDSLASGQSTFMVEMTETANILHNASPRSVVLLDEIGRGTATFDGLSIAWAVVEHLHEIPDTAARTLFATHYHELTELALVLPRVMNLRMTAREHDGKIVFLHRLEEGAADQSYGIQVAALAGVPGEVVSRAREILINLESDAVGRDGRPKLARHSRAHRSQMALFAGEAQPPRLGGRAAAVARRRAASDLAPGVAATEREIVAEVRKIDPAGLTPLEALQILDRLQRRLAADGD